MTAKKTTPSTPTDETAQDSMNAERGVIHFPNGLFGFPDQKRFVVLASPEEAPFLRLQSVEDSTLNFLVVSPTAVAEDYHPEVSEADTQSLGLKGAHDALLFNIVSIQSDGEATANFKGPIVVNRRTLVGRQIIPVNSSACPVRYPIRAMAAA